MELIQLKVNELNDSRLHTEFKDSREHTGSPIPPDDSPIRSHH